MPDPNDDILLPGGRAVPTSKLRIKFVRSSGPGGQNVNKLSTAAELRLTVEDLTELPPDARDRLRTLAGSRLTNDDELILVNESERSQEGNRREVMARLRQMLVQCLRRPKPRKKTRPSRASKERRLKAKKVRGEVKTLRQKPA
ncbi:MAG: alternative ribosome rescue aminoacyl-tRNA hydrolase ArfB [Phycisphaerae bacterium]